MFIHHQQGLSTATDFQVSMSLHLFCTALLPVPSHATFSLIITCQSCVMNTSTLCLSDSSPASRQIGDVLAATVELFHPLHIAGAHAGISKDMMNLVTAELLSLARNSVTAPGKMMRHVRQFCHSGLWISLLHVHWTCVLDCRKDAPIAHVTPSLIATEMYVN
jgi:hypothetical protein